MPPSCRESGVKALGVWRTLPSDTESLLFSHEREGRMTVELLFVQGGGDGTHDEWDNKLVDSLAGALGRHYRIRYPRMPDEDDPRYASWKATLIDEYKRLQDGAIL